ncbi:MAG: outer membrane beta-barrel protein, partial [Polyangia bacterium]
MKSGKNTLLLSSGVLTAGLLAALAGGAPRYAMAAEASPANKAAVDETPLDQPFEIGIFGGLHFYDKQSGLGRYVGSPEGYSPDLGGAFGLRLSYNIIPWVGVELEGMISPTHTRYTDASGGTREIIVGYRGQVIGNFIHTGYVRPFALVGWGALSEFPKSSPGPNGEPFKDTDDMFHVGVGSKFPIVDNFGLRLDGRIMFPPAAFVNSSKYNEGHFHAPDYEILLAAYLAFGGTRP